MRSKRWFAALLSLCLLCPLLGTVRAYEAPDLTKTGSITVEMRYEGEPVTGGALSAYYVGQLQDNGGGYSFVKTPEMADFSGSYSDITSPKLARDLADFVREQGLPARADVKNEKGEAVFSDLALGLYLILQTEPSDGFEPISPFLVSVPMNQGAGYIYDVTANGKFQLDQTPEPSESPKPSESPNPSESPKPSESPEPSESPKPSESPNPSESPKPSESPNPSESPEPSESPNPTESPTPSETPGPTPPAESPEPTPPVESTPPATPSEPPKPDEPKLPQTGQLNWPIPVLTAAGLLLFSIGWFLRFGKRKDSYEE